MGKVNGLNLPSVLVRCVSGCIPSPGNANVQTCLGWATGSVPNLGVGVQAEIHDLILCDCALIQLKKIYCQLNFFSWERAIAVS